MTQRLSQICVFCKHFGRDVANDRPTCDAYPDGIPDDIYLNGADHRMSQPGDHGIHFEYGDRAPKDFVDVKIKGWEESFGNRWN
jgi:hypothetical protein